MTEVLPIRRLQLAVGLLSAGVTAQQLALMQVLAYVHWYHFAYMVVAVALLGFGAAGTILACWRSRLLAKGERLLPGLCWGAALALPLGLWVSQRGALSFDLQLLFIQPGQWLALFGLYLLVLPTFVCGGLATSLVLTLRAQRAGAYYAASLAGAGLGGALGLIALETIAPARLPGVASLGPALAALVLGWPARARGRLAAGAALVLVGLAVVAPPALQPSQFKPISGALDLPGARVIAGAPAAAGWLEAVAAPALRPAPELSLGFAGEIPPHPALFNNGLPHGALLPPGPPPTWLAFRPEAAVYAAAPPPRQVLLLETGPGGGAAAALARGADRVVVVEPHPALAAWARSPAGQPVPWTEWQDPRVQVVTGSGRWYLARTDERFDVIHLPVADTGGGAGLAAMAERPLLTREAFAAAWTRLTPEGMVVLTSPLEHPVRPALRVLATWVDALDAEGALPAAHLAALRTWNSVTFLARRSPWDANAGAALRTFADEHGFDLLTLPGLAAQERQRFHAWPDPELFVAVDALLGPERGVSWRKDYIFAVGPATDERPWFGRFLRWDRLPELAARVGWTGVPFQELGTVLVVLTFVQLAVLAVICTLLPLPWLRGARRGRGATLLYFAALGLGFMLLEVGLMIRLNTWLGQPLRAAGIVLSGLLVCSGLGSRWSERLPPSGRVRAWVTATAAGAALGGGALIAVVASVTAGWATTAQTVLALVLIAPIGFALGCAFPLGLRHLHQHDPAQIPWAWGINGCVSVATPAAALLLAAEAGLGAVFVVAAIAYAGAALAALRPI